MNPDYFRYLDRLLGFLVEHGIVPVLQPVFQGAVTATGRLRPGEVIAADPARAPRIVIFHRSVG